MAVHEALASPLGAAAVVILVVFLVLYLTFAAFALVGFSPGEVVVLVFLAPFASGINIQVAERPGVILAINAAGVFIPVLLTVRFALQGRLPLGRTLVATGVVTVVAWGVSRPTPEGIMVLLLPVVLATTVVTGLLTRAKPGVTGPIAFTAGSIGTLVGADILRLPSLEDPTRAEPLVASIGGAGTFDAIYVVGLAAVLIEILAVGAATLGRRALGRRPAR